MSPPLRLKPAAVLDVADPPAWHEGQRPGLGDDFAGDLDPTLSLIAAQPETRPLVDGGIRRALLRRFPCGVFFVIDATEVVVLGVLHAARDSRTWPTATRGPRPRGPPPRPALPNARGPAGP